MCGHKKTADYLLSRLVATTIGVTGLTSVFGMGTGVAPPLYVGGKNGAAPRETRRASCSNSGKGNSPDRRDGGEAITVQKCGQADRPISTGQLNPLLDLHLRPINVVVFNGPDGET